MSPSKIHEWVNTIKRSFLYEINLLLIFSFILWNYFEYFIFQNSYHAIFSFGFQERNEYSVFGRFWKSEKLILLIILLKIYYTHTHTQRNIYIYIYIYIHSYVYMHVYIHTYPQKYSYTHIHTHIYSSSILYVHCTRKLDKITKRKIKYTRRWIVLFSVIFVVHWQTWLTWK